MCSGFELFGPAGYPADFAHTVNSPKPLLIRDLRRSPGDVHETDFGNMPAAFAGELTRTNDVRKATLC